MKKTLSILLAFGLIGSALMVPAVGQEAPPPEVPAEPNIVDPAGDSNFINEGTAAGLGHNHAGPAGVSTVADLFAVWLTHDAENVSVHFQTDGPPPATANGITYQLFIAPGSGSVGENTQGCLRFLVNIPAANANGGTYQDEAWVRLVDRCNTGTSVFSDAVDGTFSIAAGPDDTGITTITFPRSASPLLADGLTLTAPQARASSPTIGSHTAGLFASPSTDDTEVGTDYVLTAEEPPPAEPPVKKGCKKGSPKAKKKGCKKR